LSNVIPFPERQRVEVDYRLDAKMGQPVYVFERLLSTGRVVLSVHSGVEVVLPHDLAIRMRRRFEADPTLPWEDALRMALDGDAA